MLEWRVMVLGKTLNLFAAEVQPKLSMAIAISPVP